VSPTSDGISHSRTTERLHTEQQHLRQTVLPYTLPKRNGPPVLFHIHSLVRDLVGSGRVHRIVALGAKSIIVATSMGIWGSSVELGHLEEAEHQRHYQEARQEVVEAKLMCILTADHATLYTQADRFPISAMGYTLVYPILRRLICGPSELDNYPSLG
jgi:hypothetical protein